MADQKLSATFISMFKEPIEGFLNCSVLRRAREKKLIETHFFSVLEEVQNNHHKVDDTPYGGGPGELMRVDVMAPMIKKALEKNDQISREKKRVIVLDPSGTKFDQTQAKRLANYDELIFVCGRYEGIDARIYSYVDEAISLGDFVLSNGDLAALAIFDATARMVPGVLGNFQSIDQESHIQGRLEASHFTRPKIFEGHEVPDFLASGHHKKIAQEKTLESLKKTLKLRPDLLEKFPLNAEEKKLLHQSNNFEQKYFWEQLCND